MKKINLTIILLFISIFSAFAQYGKINGKVIDARTGEALIGATISISIINSNINDAKEKIVDAAVSDLDGNFFLGNIPKGKVSLRCSYLSYETKIVKDINIIPEKMLTLNLALKQAIKELGQIVVSAKAVTNNEIAMQTIQRKSAGLVNGISSKQISRMGDSEAASALKRVSGVSVDAGKYVYVRGLSDRYSKVSLNKAEIPGLDPNKNTVQMDIFPSNIIENIVVYKTFTPNLPGSFAGGFINITTKSFPEKFTLQVSTSLGYNPNANLINDFTSYDGGKFDAFGIDDGTREIPKEAGSEIPFLYQDNNKLDKITSSFNKTMKTAEKKSFLNHSHAVAVGNQFEVFGKPLGVIIGINYSRSFKHYNKGSFSKYSLVNSGNEKGIMSPLIIQTENRGQEETLLSAILGFTYKLSQKSKIGFTFLRNNSGLISSRFREGNKTEDDIYVYQNTLGFQERSFNSTQLSGKHIIKNMNNLEINWISSYTLSGQSEPDLRFFNYDHNGNQFKISPNAYPAPARFYREMNEYNFDNKLNIINPIKIFGEKAKLKIGGAFIVKDRDSRSRQFDLLSQGLAFNGNISEYLKDENLGQNATGVVYGFYYQNDKLTDNYNSYKARELLSAGYMMIDLPMGEKFRFVLGARYEYDKSFVENNVEANSHKHVSAEHTYPNDILPSLNINYSITKNTNLRFSTSRTLARASFREIAPYAYYDFKEGWRVVGNPELKRTLINNFDLRLEHFMKKGQIASISLFYKQFYNPIELVDDPRANNPEFHYVNTYKSNLYGIEIELRKRLDFIGLDNFLLGGNFTLLKSEVKTVADYGADRGILTIKRPMYGQSPWVLNSFITYENKDKGIYANLVFNISGEKLAVVTKGETPNIFSMPFANMNFNISKTFAKKLTAKISIVNILDSINKKTYTYEDTEYIYQKYAFGRSYSLSISYTIK